MRELLSFKFQAPVRLANSDLSNWLTPGEARAFEGIRVPKRRADWLAGRCAAKELVRRFLLKAQKLKLTPAQIEILYDEHGAPKALAPSHLELQLSLAHSAGYGFAGLSTQGSIGVDLQQIRPVHSDLKERVLTERECAQLAQHFAAREAEGVLVFWTLKEAAIKAHRARPAPGFREIVVRLGEPGHAEILLRSQKLRAQWGRWKEFIWAWAAF